MQDSWTGKLQKEGAIRYRGNYEETMPNHLSREPLGGSQASKNAKERRREPGGIQIQCEAYIQTLWLMRCNEIDRVSAELSHSNIFEPCLDWKTRLCCKGGGGPCWAVSCHWAVIELSLSCHWAVCLEAWWHNSRSWREHLCWPGVAKHKARTFRLYDSPFEIISGFSFFFPNVTNDDISYIIALSQCPCFVRLFPLHLSQNLLHGQYFIWVLHSLHAPDPQTWAFLSKVFGKHCWVRVCPLETSKIFKQHSSSHAGGLLNGAETERSAPNIFWIPVLHKLHRIAFDSSSPHRCWLVFYRSWVAKLCIPSKSQAKSRLSQT